MIKWSILIATCPPRAAKFRRIMGMLMPQIDKYNGQIEVIVFFNNFDQPSLGHIRQRLMDEAQGEYLNFIDDDDIVPKDYCDTILPLLDGVDYIGFNVELRNEGKRLRRVYHSLQYPGWSEDEDAYYRGVTHLNPIKAELARTGSFPSIDVGEDYDWCMMVQKHINDNPGQFTEHYLERNMYVYDHFGHDHMEPVPVNKPKRPVITSKNVRFHPEST